MNPRPAATLAPLALLALSLAGCKGDAPKVEPSAPPPPSPAAVATPVPPPPAPPASPAAPSPAPSVAAAAPGGAAAAKLAALDGRTGREAEYQAILTRLAAKTGGSEDAVAEGAITVHNTTNVSCLQALQQMEAAGTGAGAAVPPPGPGR